MLFYSALHVTSAYMLSFGLGVPPSHQAMNVAIAARPELDARFRSAYTTLTTFSWNIRYTPGFTMRPAESLHLDGPIPDREDVR